MNKLAAKFYIWTKKDSCKPQFRFDHKSKDPDQYGLVSLPEAWTKENPRPLNSDPNAADTLGFSGVKGDGSMLLTRVVRRNGRRSEVLVYLRLPSGDEFVLPNRDGNVVYNTDDRSFTAGGLHFEILEPLRRWRVTFNGYLKRHYKNEERGDAVVPVRFYFVWHPIYCYLEFPEDIRHDVLAALLSRMKSSVGQFVPPWTLFNEQWHEQIGELHGIVHVDNSLELELFFRGLKTRKHGTVDLKAVVSKLSIQGYVENATAFHLFAEDTVSDLANFVYGYVCSPCLMVIHHFTSCSFDFKTLYKRLAENAEVSFTFMAGGKSYALQIAWNGSDFRTEIGPDFECAVAVQNVDVTLNGKRGRGIVEYYFPCQDKGRSSVAKVSLPYLRETDFSGDSKVVVSFEEEDCRCSKVVGGKGASLALMSAACGKNFKADFSIPKGICITKFAFELHLKESPELVSALRSLEDVAWTRTPGVLMDECEKVTTLIKSMQLPSHLKTELEKHLSDVFGSDFEKERFAVRSSAIGEDGEELSAAGQNETFLGVRSFHEICDAVIKCWASQFAFRSVEYKRQNGQLLNGGMGVVIQKMVAADIAGVLFSRDPLSGSLATMTIASNFGLGESVVSAAADPDTITVNRSFDDELTVRERKVGSKAVMVSMSETSGITELGVDADRAGNLSLSDENALRLGQIAIILEQCYGSAQDIEWAMEGDLIYLLQSRPVTTQFAMTDFEVIHEFDTSMRTDGEYYTTANIGEVMPGAMVPLSMTAAFRSQIPLLQSEMTWRILKHRYDPTVPEMFAIFYGHVLSERLQLKALSLSEKKSGTLKAIEMSLYGRVLDDVDELNMALDRYAIKPPWQASMTMLYMTMKGVVWGQRHLDIGIKKYQNAQDPTIGCASMQEAYVAIQNRLPDIIQTMWPHFLVTVTSTMWNIIVLNLLSQGAEYTMDQYSDFAMLVGSCNGAVSGDVPFSLKNLALTIATEVEPKKFNNLSSEEALHWLQNNKENAGKQFEAFLEKHGHRGLREFCFSCTSWAMDPKQLIAVLQNMLKNPEFLEKQQESNVEDVIGNLKTPLSAWKRRWLAWAMKRCRTGVCNRERGKSLLIKTYESIRLGYRSLASMMVKEGLLPDPNLIFFCTHEEIANIIESRSAKIIRRVKHRARLHPHMDKLKFGEMIHGYPIPIDDSRRTELIGDCIEITGYPVSQGVVEAPARVVETFHDVGTIQPGEILITFATDIGWSPYFPILAGVVTEIGGLISHGAVVAREFGLPCIVGAQNATRVFKSGDVVLLNATKGTITKITDFRQEQQ